MSDHSSLAGSETLVRSTCLRCFRPKQVVGEVFPRFRSSSHHHLLLQTNSSHFHWPSPQCCSSGLLFGIMSICFAAVIVSPRSLSPYYSPCNCADTSSSSFSHSNWPYCAALFKWLFFYFFMGRLAGNSAHAHPGRVGAGFSYPVMDSGVGSGTIDCGGKMERFCSGGVGDPRRRLRHHGCGCRCRRG